MDSIHLSMGHQRMARRQRSCYIKLSSINGEAPAFKPVRHHHSFLCEACSKPLNWLIRASASAGRSSPLHATLLSDRPKIERCSYSQPCVQPAVRLGHPREHLLYKGGAKLRPNKSIVGR